MRVQLVKKDVEEGSGLLPRPVLNLVRIVGPCQQGVSLSDAINLPLYQQIANDLRSKIASGSLTPGDRLPSTRQMMETYKASNNVVRNAITVLKNEGLLAGSPGLAVEVIATPEAVAEERASLAEVKQEGAELREALRELREQVEQSQPADVSSRIDELEANLRLLYDRLGQPYPHGQNTPQQRRRKPGA